MRPAGEMAPKLDTTERHLAGAAAVSFDSLKEQLRTAFKELERTSHQSKPVEDVQGSDDRLDEPLRATLKDLQRPSPRTPVEEDKPVERDDLHSGFTPDLDHEASEREANYDLSTDKKMTRRGSRGFTRYLVAILIGVAATLAWQSYGEAAKQMFAAKAPELGWSPETKQMIANSIQWLGWTKPSASPERQPPPVAQTAPAAASIDPEKVQQMARDLATLRQTVEQLAAGLDQVTREIGKLEAADVEILAKITPAPPPPRPIAAPVRKPTPIAPVTPPTSLAPVPPPDR